MGTDLSLSFNFLAKLESPLVQIAVWSKISCAHINLGIRWRTTVKNNANALYPQWL